MRKSEAAKNWCPLTPRPDPENFPINDFAYRCITDCCMAWVIDRESLFPGDEDDGHCGLADTRRRG